MGGTCAYSGMVSKWAPHAMALMMITELSALYQGHTSYEYMHTTKRLFFAMLSSFTRNIITHFNLPYHLACSNNYLLRKIKCKIKYSKQKNTGMGTANVIP